MMKFTFLSALILFSSLGLPHAQATDLPDANCAAIDHLIEFNRYDSPNTLGFNCAANNDQEISIEELQSLKLTCNKLKANTNNQKPQSDAERPVIGYGIKGTARSHMRMSSDCRNYELCYSRALITGPKDMDQFCYTYPDSGFINTLFTSTDYCGKIGDGRVKDMAVGKVPEKSLGRGTLIPFMKGDLQAPLEKTWTAYYDVCFSSNHASSTDAEVTDQVSKWKKVAKKTGGSICDQGTDGFWSKTENIFKSSCASYQLKKAQAAVQRMGQEIGRAPGDTSIRVNHAPEKGARIAPTAQGTKTVPAQPVSPTDANRGSN